MKALALAIILGLLSGGAARCDQAELYVSPKGNDADSGTKSKPFRSFERARDAVRKINKDQKIIVYLNAGIYERQKPLELTAEDSGSSQYPVVWQGMPGEEVRIVGGKAVTEWKPVTDENILSRLAPAARGKIFQADLKALGITTFGQVKDGGLQLFFNDKPMTLARWPKEGFVKITGLVEPDTINVRGTRASKTGKFMYEGDEPKRWTGEKDIWVHGYWFWDWSEEREKVESIDTDRHIISLLPPYHSFGYRVGQWFYALNILAEVSAPGDWYLDRDTGILYFWPPAPLESGRAVVSVADTLVSLADVSNVTLEGVILEDARGTAITIKGGSQAKIAGCVLRNLGGWGVNITGGVKNGVAGCDIYQTGKGGIGLSGNGIYVTGNKDTGRKTLTPSGNFADNNHIHNYSLWNRTYQAAISIGGVGNSATHNLIHDAPHMAIGFSGNDHVIEFNEIYNVCEESNDAGAIYAGRDWTMRGTVINHNYLHDISGFQGRGCVGIYLDDMFCGTTISGNVFYQVTNAAFIGGGRDNLVENNIFVNCKPSLHIDARGLGWAKDSVDTTMLERLKAMPYSSDLWQKRYPPLVNILDDNPAAPKGNVVNHNISCGGRWDDIESAAQPYITLTNNLVDKDPLFYGTPPKSFRLQTNSPAYTSGFTPIPFEKIGLYKDEYRKALPPE